MKRSRGSGRALPENVQSLEEALGPLRSFYKSLLALGLDHLCTTESCDRSILGGPLPVEAVTRF